MHYFRVGDLLSKSQSGTAGDYIKTIGGWKTEQVRSVVLRISGRILLTVPPRGSLDKSMMGSLRGRSKSDYPADNDSTFYPVFEEDFAASNRRYT